MKKVEMEVFSDAINEYIVRTPGRNFPGTIVQGDTLGNLYAIARRILILARETGSDELEDLAADLEWILGDRIRYYEHVLKVHSFELPYNVDTDPLWPSGPADGRDQSRRHDE